MVLTLGELWVGGRKEASSSEFKEEPPSSHRSRSFSLRLRALCSQPHLASSRIFYIPSACHPISRSPSISILWILSPSKRSVSKLARRRPPYLTRRKLTSPSSLFPPSRSPASDSRHLKCNSSLSSQSLRESHPRSQTPHHRSPPSPETSSPRPSLDPYQNWRTTRLSSSYSRSAWTKSGECLPRRRYWIDVGAEV